jgi:NAD(P)-dependent dehydrogenase (short-subunit alcohol dehydrogenase family)
MFDFKDKVAVVTGAAGNLGGALAHALHKTGARTALIDLYPDRLRERCGDLAESDRHLLIGSIDITQEDPVNEAVTMTLKKFGRIDMLFNIAGGYRAGTQVSDALVDEWELMLDLNARSVFLTCRAVLPHMIERGSGHIVNIGARPGLRGAPNAAAYSAAKSAVLRLTESISAEVKNRGIHVNALVPGTIDTPANREAMPDADVSTWVSPESLCEVILFLASDAARSIYGAIIPAYGAGSSHPD